MIRFLSFLTLNLLLFACQTVEQRKQQFLLKGNIHLEAREWERAEYYFKEAVLLDSCYSDALNNLGVVGFRSGRFDLATYWFDKAVLCDPRPAYLLNRANAAFENKAWFQALNDLESVIHSNPDTVPALSLQGLVFSKLKRFDDAVASFDKAIEKDSSNALLWVNRGTLHYYRKDYRSAESDLKQALALSPLNTEALNALSMVKCESGNAETALELINKALEQEPQHPHYLNNRGYVYLQLGRLREGDADIEASMVIDPENPWVYRNRGISYLLKNDPVSAERLFRQVLASDSSVDRAGFFLVKSLFDQGRDIDACKVIKVLKPMELPRDMVRLCQ